MDYVTLGRSDLNVSRLCLGSMSWGSNNTAAEGHAQIDRSLDAGVNFIDTAEMYPTYPVLAETVGRSEEIIGDWFARTGRRDEVIVATKVAGPGSKVRDGRGYDGATVSEAIEGSLRRLQTDVIDLYQLHWPMRGSYHFRQNWAYDPSGQNREETEAHMLEVLCAMQAAIDEGKVRHFGLSNETTWGTAMWLRLAEDNDLPRAVSMQNEYSLLCRLADTDMAELCCNEDVALFPFTPMAAGLLSGKYTAEHIPPNTRRAAEPTLGGRASSPRVWPAVDAYHGVADRHGLDVNQMALAWTLTRPFVGSSIFGARDAAQLETALGAADLVLSEEVLSEIADVHRAWPMPF